MIAHLFVMCNASDYANKSHEERWLHEFLHMIEPRNLRTIINLCVHYAENRSMSKFIPTLQMVSNNVHN